MGVGPLGFQGYRKKYKAKSPNLQDWAAIETATKPNENAFEKKIIDFNDLGDVLVLPS